MYVLGLQAGGARLGGDWLQDGVWVQSGAELQGGARLQVVQGFRVALG